MIVTSTRKTEINNRVFLKINSSEFREKFLTIANEIVSNDYTELKSFAINENNKDVINQVFWYLIGSKKFNGSLNKGLILVGSYGIGKTTIMKIISEIITFYAKKNVTFISCVNLPDEIKKYGIDYFSRRPMILDEIGRESKIIKDYGTEKHPFNEVISLRYNHKAWTFGTSNYSLESYNEFYGGYISDRIKEMFNIIELRGESFRK